MKIAVTSTGPGLDDQVDTRFGRSPYFLIVDTETNKYEAIENPNVSLGGGVGIQSAQFMAERDVKVILTGNCGPNAFRTFGAAGIQVIVGISGTVRQAVEKFGAGDYSTVSSPNVDSHFGMGGGMGSGRGIGINKRGMRQGIGRGMRMPIESKDENITLPTDSYTVKDSNKKQIGGKTTSKEDLEILKSRAKAMEEQIRELKARIKDIEQGSNM